MFSYLCCGINFIDIAYLKRSNIKGDRIVYSRHKTGKIINFPLQPHAIELIKKYTRTSEGLQNAFGEMSQNINPISKKVYSDEINKLSSSSER